MNNHIIVPDPREDGNVSVDADFQHLQCGNVSGNVSVDADFHHSQCGNVSGNVSVDADCHHSLG